MPLQRGPYIATPIFRAANLIRLPFRPKSRLRQGIPQLIPSYPDPLHNPKHGTSQKYPRFSNVVMGSVFWASIFGILGLCVRLYGVGYERLGSKLRVKGFSG